ncbi:hypothetical protein Tco_1413688, partial [Tanacetum coccineum]
MWSVLVSEENSDYLDIEDRKCGVAASPVSDGLRAECISACQNWNTGSAICILSSCNNFSKPVHFTPDTRLKSGKAEKSKVSQAHNGDTESPIHSWFPNAALEKTLGKEPDQLQSPVNLFNKRENGSEPSSISSSSPILLVHEIPPDSQSATTQSPQSQAMSHKVQQHRTSTDSVVNKS